MKRSLLQRWSFETGQPIFSSACAWGGQHCADRRNAANCSSTTDRVIVFGSHNHFIYCLSVDGLLKWKFETSDPVYGSPFVFTLGGNALHCNSLYGTNSGVKHIITDVVGVGCISGQFYLLDLKDGSCIATFSFPGEVFSSCVFFKNNLLIGCRNNYAYCLVST